MGGGRGQRGGGGGELLEKIKLKKNDTVAAMKVWTIIKFCLFVLKTIEGQDCVSSVHTADPGPGT